MKVTVAETDIRRIIPLIPEERRKQFLDCADSSRQLWIGTVEGELVCVWGLIPPTLLSSRAYLWLYTTDKLKGNEFIFVRHSQRVIEAMLREYPIICGHTVPDVPSTHRWLRWLGARFFEPAQGLIPFEIRKKCHG